MDEPCELTDDNGFFEIPFNVSASDALGNFTLQFEYSGTPLLKEPQLTVCVGRFSNLHAGDFYGRKPPAFW